ncbi:hypothetical protein DTO207G8_345 [Paecilomyces variotii]|nr:hypothetical protein DTO169C6_1567 [Paecilomyces variotii]KAJ9233727.1 hypothetical protein DTO169E5_6932 [Paecilomyces variotii]KAJ9261195.1 hypothetical protein DTO207G8_345 [Paecilomyces variotii]KAJ9266804.1 hypothetical protein DTO195F2_739 [Paecilomyces variotii]KAJ9411783.1 hypothetical protein DTO045G8_690 [Paecilomyces variotii]
MSGLPGRLHYKRSSSHRFQQIPEMASEERRNPNDATIDIPLSNISSRGQTRTQQDTSYEPHSDFSTPFENNEKGDLSHQGPGRRRRLADKDAKNMEDPQDGSLNRLGRMYTAILNFSVVTRYIIYVSPLALLIAVPIIVGATDVGQNAKIGGVKIVWFFTWIEVVWLSLWTSKLVSHTLPYVFQFLCGIVSSGTRKYALILRALEIPMSLVFWCIVSLVTFLPIMTLNPDNKRENDTSTKSWEKTIKNILFGFLVCSIIFLGEKLIVQLISVSYHRKQFDLRIRASKHNIYLLGELYEASRKLFPEFCKEFREEDEIVSDSLLATKRGKHSKHLSATVPLRLMRNVGYTAGRIGDKMTAAFGNVAQEITGQQLFNVSSSHSIVLRALERKRASEALARRIWMSFVVEGNDTLSLEDIVEVLGPERQAEADECFAILDRDGNGDVSLEEMILTVTELGRTRKSLAKSMHDVDQAIHVLDNLLLTVAFIIMVLVFISFVTSGFGTVIAAGATSLLSLSFVFATTCQEVLGSCIFLFVKHPFDVGDRVTINNEDLIVERISLLFTVFRSIDDQRTTQCPNIVLNTLWVDNLTRSDAMRERLTLTVDFGTSFADVQLLKKEMENFVRDKENYRDFQPDVDVEVLGIGNMDKLELRVEIRHKSNWSNESIRATRRSKFMCALVVAVRKIPIYGPGGGGAALGDPSNPSYSVSVTDEQAKAYREKAAQDKEAGRMIPKSQLKDLKSLTESPILEAKSTGIDLGNSASSVQHRGAATPADADAAFISALTARAPGEDKARPEDDNLYRAATGSTAGGPNADTNETTGLLREVSTGRRKKSTTSRPGTGAAVAPAISAPAEYEEYSTYYDQAEEGPSHPYRQQYMSQPGRPYESTPAITETAPTPSLQVPSARRPVQGSAISSHSSQSQNPPSESGPI